MLALLLLLQAAPPADIVVRARRSGEVLTACRARACPANEEANAALAHADQQFLVGDYHGARSTLSSTLSRVKDSAAGYPRLVSALHEARSRVGLHLGDTRLFRTGLAASVRTLEANLPPGDPQALYAAGSYGDMWTTLGDLRQARLAYRSAEDAADRAGNGMVRDAIRLRRAWLENTLGDKAQATRMAAAIAAGASPALANAARLLAARMAVSNGDSAAADALIAELRLLPAEQKPSLLYSPPLPVSQLKAIAAEQGKFAPMRGFEPRSASASPILWADIGYWVRPDGTAAQAEVIRGSSSRAWTSAILATVARRRFVPFVAETGDPGRYRMERYSLAGTYMVPTGSVVRQRVGAPELRVLDLSDAAVDAAAPGV